MLYISSGKAVVTGQASAMDTGDSQMSSAYNYTGGRPPSGRPSISVVEDEVDQILNKEDGRIPRGKNEQM